MLVMFYEYEGAVSAMNDIGGTNVRIVEFRLGRKYSHCVGDNCLVNLFLVYFPGINNYSHLKYRPTRVYNISTVILLFRVHNRTCIPDTIRNLNRYNISMAIACYRPVRSCVSFCIQYTSIDLNKFSHIQFSFLLLFLVEKK